MTTFNKHYRALDHVIVAMAAMQKGKPVLAAKYMQTALACSDYTATIAALDQANDVLNKKPTLAQALSVVAAAAKKGKKPAKKPAKKKVKADADEGFEMVEDDLLDDDVEAAEGEDGDGEDLDLDSLSLDDDDDEALAGEDDLDLDGMDDGDDVLEMPEATADSLGTDDDPTDSGADVTDNGEPSTDTDRVANPGETARARRVAAQASRRVLANIQALERLDSQVAAKVSATAKTTAKKPAAK